MNLVPEFHTKIRELRDAVRSHAQEATEPRCKVLCDTSGEVLAGLESAFDHYLHSSGA